MGRIHPLVAAALFAGASARPWLKRQDYNSTTPASNSTTMYYEYDSVSVLITSQLVIHLIVL